MQMNFLSSGGSSIHLPRVNGHNTHIGLTAAQLLQDRLMDNGRVWPALHQVPSYAPLLGKCVYFVRPEFALSIEQAAIIKEMPCITTVL